ncbi:MAG: Eco57I restriction-modification methylase domain-containing protein [Deltaproteobacteria bacterium]|nr:Eco57I restriction-modification methylase domain-containing protein [Deltaproteobacteria bacterium]
MPKSTSFERLFHKTTLARRVTSHNFKFPADLDERHAEVLKWIRSLEDGRLDTAKETGLDGDFLRDIFGSVLGYTRLIEGKSTSWDLVKNPSIKGGGIADGGLGFFSKDDPSNVLVPIELKDAKTDLDRSISNGRTPVRQGWDYANDIRNCQWLIVSNFRETRLYHTSQTPQVYERFLLEELADEARFKEFFYILSKGNFFPAHPGAKTTTDELLEASLQAEKEVTAKLYGEYKRLRHNLFASLAKAHPDRDPIAVLEKTQKLLDRVLFVAFAEDRGLLPAHTLRDAYAHEDAYNPRPKWDNYKAVFRWINEGNDNKNVPAYNGGLFRDDPELESLAITNEHCHGFEDLGEYDFTDDVSVLVLGHIFEQSISDLEEMRAQVESDDYREAQRADQKNPDKRKKEGVFYTPSFITRYIVDETIGRVLADKKRECFGGKDPDDIKVKSKKIAAWEAYRDALLTTRVIDPACGSGAFLVAAFDYLYAEYEVVNAQLAELRAGQTTIFDLSKTILNNNIYGVDLNNESVEITRLSLWLKTAERGKPLTALDHNIRCGNSVIADPSVDERAFDWQAAFPEVFGPDGPGGFDVVIGNPPYVRQELLSPLKPYFKDHYASYHGVADLYTYFYELGVRLLHAGGRMSYIVTNKWLRSGYGEALRDFFAKSAVFESIVDFGHAPIFEDADTFPCIVLLRKPDTQPDLSATHPLDAKPEPDAPVVVCPVPREELPKINLKRYVGKEGYAVPWSRYGADAWSLERPDVVALMDKIKRLGVPLKDYLGVKPYRGVLTGLNEAFLIDTLTKDRLVRDDPKCADIIKPYLRGQDIKRWVPEWAGLWMIAIASSGDRSWPWSGKDEADAERVFSMTYPSIAAHFAPLKAKMKKRYDKGHYYWELRACAYYAEFEKPKIVWKDLSTYSEFSCDVSGKFTNDLCFILPKLDIWILGLLNSPIAWTWLWHNAMRAINDTLRLKNIYMEVVPVVAPVENEESTDIVGNLVDFAGAHHKESAEMLDWLALEYAIEKPGQKLEDFPALTEKEFIVEAKKRMPKERRELSPKDVARLKEVYGDYAPDLQGKRAEALRLERRLSDLVNEAYGLTPEEIALMWRTAPPRMPIPAPDYLDAATTGEI